MNQPKQYRLSSHAAQRVAERTNLSPEGMAQALNERGVVTRSQPGGDFENVLVWLPESREVFVAVANRYTGDVLTVYPVIHPETGRMALLTDGKPFGEREWTQWPRWNDLRYAILRVEDELPDCPVAEIIRWHEENDGDVPPGRHKPAPPKLVARLRIGYEDGSNQVIRAGAEAVVAEVAEHEADRVLPALFERLADRLMTGGATAVNRIDSIVVEIVQMQKGHQVGMPKWDQVLMANGVVGPRCRELFEGAFQALREGEEMK